jgi:hypothetical protein
LSQLVDQELPADAACQLLLDVLDDAEARQRLQAMLQLRHMFGSWRQQEPRGAIVAMPPQPQAGTASPALWRPMSLAAAALLGGVLVAAGFLLGGRHLDKRPVASTAEPSAAPASRSPEASGEEPQPVMVVTPEQRREIARAFALHESVAGPLSWYASDDATIQIAPAGKMDEKQPPIAVVLRLRPAAACKGNQTKTYVIVCRNNDPAAIELPQTELARNVSFRLLPTAADSKVNLQYAISTDGADRGANAAALVGHRNVGLGQTSLGQLALDDCLVNIDASSWVIRDERKP